MQVRIKNDSVMGKAERAVVTAAVSFANEFGAIRGDKYDTSVTWNDLTAPWDSYTNPWDDWLLTSTGSTMKVGIKSNEAQVIKVS